MTRSRLRPKATAMAATVQSASNAPMPTLTGSYRAARVAVRICVRSPNSATSTTMNDAPATASDFFSPLMLSTSLSPSSAASSGSDRSSNTAPTRNSTAVTISTGRRGSAATKPPATHATATWTAKAAQTPARTGTGE